MAHIEEKSNRLRTQKDVLSCGQEVLWKSGDKIRDIIYTLKGNEIYGPLMPALQHLEEAVFWLGKCEAIHSEELLRMKREEDKED